MRRVIIAIGALLALGAGSAMAADPGAPPAPGEQLAQVPPAPPPAWGYNWTGPYVGINGGGGWGHTGWTYLTVPGHAAFATASHDTSGGLAGGTIGYNWQFDPNWVVGGEVDEDWADLTGHRACPNPAFTCRSLIEDLGTARLRLGWTADRLMLFGTGGLAWGDMRVRTVNTAGAAIPPSGGPVNGTTSTRLGWSAGAGVEYALWDSLSAKLEWIHYDLGSHLFNVDSPTAQTVRASEHGDLVRAGLNWTFNAPPPPPPPVMAPPVPPAPPPVTRKVFLVFFDWDRDTITPEGMRIIEQAAAAFRSGAPVRIMVTGYTDRSGSPGYNQRLSERRANNVANALARLGVPREQMAVSGRGENDNRVPTAPGVREPQNRRVEIVFP